MGQRVRRSYPEVLLLVALSCTRDPPVDSHREPQGSPPVLHCAADAAQRLPELPGEVSGFCLPRAADVRRYGMGREAGLSGICDELFADQCEFYKTLGLRALALAAFRYQTSSRELGIVVLEFEDAPGAFGFVQARALGQGSGPSRSLPLEGARAHLGGAVLRLWRGRRAFEVTYRSEDQTVAEAESTASEVLSNFAEKVVRSFEGAAPEPYEIRFFEQAEGLSRLGPALLVTSALGVSQSGPGATVDLEDEGGKYRALVFARLDEPSAKDLIRTIQTGLGAPPLGKKTGILRARRLRAEAEPESWYFSRVGRVVLGVGPRADGRTGALDDAPRSLMESRLDRLAQRARAFRPPGSRQNDSR